MCDEPSGDIKGDDIGPHKVKAPWYFKLLIRGDTTSAHYRDFTAGGLGHLLGCLVKGYPITKRDLDLFGLTVEVEDDVERRVAEQGNRSHFDDRFKRSADKAEPE